MSDIRVSVVIPAHNAARWIERAVASVLTQTERRLEVLVVDDVSIDDTVARVETLADADSRVRLWRLARNGGPGVARNHAIDVARGEWVALLDADDRYRPERLARLLALAEAHGADMAADNLLLCPEQRVGETAPMFSSGELPGERLLDARAFVDGNLGGSRERRFGYGYLKPVIRRAFLRRAALAYDPARLAEDYLFYLRCLLAGARWVVTPETMYEYTVSASSLTSRHAERDLVLLRDLERGLLDAPAVRADATLAASLRRHLRSVDLALAWFRFAEALKGGGAVRALATLRPGHIPYVAGQGLRAVPRALRKAAAAFAG